MYLKKKPTPPKKDCFYAIACEYKNVPFNEDPKLQLLLPEYKLNS